MVIASSRLHAAYLYWGAINCNCCNNYNLVQFVTASKQVESKTRHTGFIGLSAWGIIGVVGGSLLLGTVFYYAVLFYPILCKKERKYDIMELSTV